MTTTILDLPSPAQQAETEHGGADLVLRREDILFFNLFPTEVCLRLRIRNRGTRGSAPTPLRIESAPFGAFVRTSPLLETTLEAIPAGGQRLLEFSFPVRSLAAPPRLPRRLLTAISGGDEEGRKSRRAGTRSYRDAIRSVHWAGNFNVFIGIRETERHLARAVRIRPGRTNLALFQVGSGNDAYRFSHSLLEEDWRLHLVPLAGGLLDLRMLARRFGSEVGGDGLPGVGGAWEEWVEFHGTGQVMLSFVPPEGIAKQGLDITVEERSSRRKAQVEFQLDPLAQGPGCYVVG